MKSFVLNSEIEAAIQFQEIVAPYRTVNATAFIAHKVRQREEYLAQLRSTYKTQYA